MIQRSTPFFAAKATALARTLLAVTTFLTIHLAPSIGLALPLIVGAEIELTKPHFAKTKNFASLLEAQQSAEKREQLLLTNAVRELCATAGCKITEVDGKWGKMDDFRVQYADSWWFQISYDTGCLEILFKPSTLDEIEAHKQIINEHLFGVARSLGFTTDPLRSNHYNFDAESAFGESAEDFLRFFVDYNNHADLALGSLGSDRANAPPLSLQGEDQRNALQTVIDTLYAGAINSVFQAARMIQETVYTSTFMSGWFPTYYYQAIGMKKVTAVNWWTRNKRQPFEMRAIFAQADAETFIQIGRLLEARIRYLNEKKMPIIYTKTSRESFTPIELKTRFYMFVEESGLKFADYQNLLKIDDVRNAPLAAFLEPEKYVVESRILTLEDYWDLLPVSEYFREQFVKTLSHPEAIKHPEARRLFNRLENDLAKIQERLVNHSAEAGSRRNWFGKIVQSPSTNDRSLFQALSPLHQMIKPAFLALRCDHLFMKSSP